MTQDAVTATARSNATSKAIQQVQDRLARAQEKVSGLERRLVDLSARQQRVNGLEREQLAREWAQARIELGMASNERHSAEMRLDELLGGHEGHPAPVTAVVPAPPAPTTVAVEAIALEVERIGEAQRYTTKLIAERQLDVAPRIPVQPRREPGTITPH